MEPWIEAREIRYRRIGNERRIPFAFWPDSQECLHRTRLIVSPNFSLSFIHAKFDNKTKEEFSSWYVPTYFYAIALYSIQYTYTVKSRVLTRLVQKNIVYAGFFRLLMKGIFEPYCKVASSNTSSLETHAGFFRLLMKGILQTLE